MLLKVVAKLAVKKAHVVVVRPDQCGQNSAEMAHEVVSIPAAIACVQAEEYEGDDYCVTQSPGLKLVRGQFTCDGKVFVQVCINFERGHMNTRSLDTMLLPPVAYHQFLLPAVVNQYSYQSCVTLSSRAAESGGKPVLTASCCQSVQLQK